MLDFAELEPDLTENGKAYMESLRSVTDESELDIKDKVAALEAFSNILNNERLADTL